MKKSKQLSCWMALLILLMCSGCSSLLYHPTHVLHYDPKQLGLEPEELAIEVAPKTQVYGWYFKSPFKKPKGVIVFFHGNAENLTSHYVSLSWILKEGYDFFIWDYRGYGKSEGTPNPQNTVEDGKTIIKYIYNKNPKLPLFVFAQSLGGNIAMRAVIDLKGEVPIKSLMVESTFESYQSEGRDLLSQHWITWILQPLSYVLLSDKYAAEAKVDQISPIPLLIIHGNKDRVVNYKFGQEIFKHAKEPKEFWTVEDGVHINSFWGPHAQEFRKKFIEYLSRF
jgi:alpha-beta hydrolase superfamily lysophospholipase